MCVLKGCMFTSSQTRDCVPSVAVVGTGLVAAAAVRGFTQVLANTDLISQEDTHKMQNSRVERQ